MKKQGSRFLGQKGFVLVYMAGALTCLLLFTGVAVDSGRAYVVKAQLTKAVDGAALAAARSLNSGTPPRTEAAKIYRANFPVGYMGTTSSTDPNTDPNFFSTSVDTVNGVNIVNVRAEAVLPTTFMRLGNFTHLTVRSVGEAQRRMVDLSLVIDVSSSIGSKWPAVRDAVREFINAFDQNGDRMSLVTYGWGADVEVAMSSSRGFNKSGMQAAVPNSLPGGITPMAEGLYRGWDELRSVSSGQQSGLRIIVLFTDGSGNAVPGLFDNSGTAKSIFTFDFPKANPDPGNLTSSSPAIQGLYQTETGDRNPSHSQPVADWRNNTVSPDMRYLPVNTVSTHSHHRSTGIPTSFPLQTNALTVDGVPQQSARGLRNFNTSQNRYPAEVWNIRNAATNLTEIIANAARSDSTGDYPIRIYSIGMGDLVRVPLGTRPESSESVLMRLANDSLSPDFNSAQLEGKYFFAQTEADVAPAFQNIRNQILRLSK